MKKKKKKNRLVKRRKGMKQKNWVEMLLRKTGLTLEQAEKQGLIEKVEL